MALDPSEFKGTPVGYDEIGMPVYGSSGGYKPWDFGSALGGYRQAGSGSMESADNPELSGYFQQKYGTAMDQAYRQQMENIRKSGGMELWNQQTGEFSGLDPRTWDQLLMPAFQASGAAADPRFQEYADIMRNVTSSGQAVDAANQKAVDDRFMKQVLTGLALTGGVMAGGASGLFGGGGGGAGGLAGGAGEAGWGVMQGAGGAGALSPEVAHALQFGNLSTATGGSGLGTAFGLTGVEGIPTIVTGGLSSASGGSGLGAPFGLEGSLVTPVAGAASGAGGQAATPGAGQGGNVAQGFKMPAQGAPGGSLSSGATQSLITPPGSAVPGAAGSSVFGGAGAGAASGGGDFLNGILEQFKKNALQLGMMGLSLALTPKGSEDVPQGAQQAVDTTAGARQLGQEYIDAARRGELTAPQAASLEKYKQDAKNQVRQYFASIGQFDSTSRLQAEAQIDQTAVAMQQQLIQQTLQNGLEALGVGVGPLNQVAQYQVGQDRRLQEAMGSFAQGLGSIFGQGAGQGQTTGGAQRQQQNPPYPPNAGPQQPAIMQPQAPAQQQPVFQDQGWNV